MNAAATPTEETQGLYHYTECGLDNVYLEGGFEIVESPYGQGVRIHDLDGLHHCIAECLVNKAGALKGPEFRFLRVELDLSQFAMGQLCGREERRVRDWENGDDPVPEPANSLIRLVYQQRYKRDTVYEELTNQIKQLQSLDKQLHELKLRKVNEGWRTVQCAA